MRLKENVAARVDGTESLVLAPYLSPIGVTFFGLGGVPDGGFATSKPRPGYDGLRCRRGLLAVYKRKKMRGFLIDRSETVGISCFKGFFLLPAYWIIQK